MSKTFLLIGGSYGIGSQIIDALPADASIYVASRTSEGLAGKNATHIPFDVLQDDLPLEKLPAVIDGFAYCPGSINLRPFKGLKPEAFTADFSINLMGAVKTLQQLQPLLAASEQASVVLLVLLLCKQACPFTQV